MPVRIEDVARVAGVSTATVSRALRGLPSVSEQTKQTVHRAAADLGYIPSRSASSLATGRTMTVGVVTPYVSRWFYATVLEAVERELRGSGYDALLVGVGEPMAGADVPFRAEMLRNRVDGVVVLTAPLTGRELDGVRALGLPTVFVGSAVAGATGVRIDDVAVGRTATEHLLSLGHRRIAHLGGDPQQPLNFSTPSDRRAGWMSALRAAGLEPQSTYDVFGDFTTRGGYAAARVLLGLPEPPTAIFAASDEMAFGVLLAARDLGVRVPEQLSVIGVDDHEVSELVGLTTLAQPVAEQGATGARLVLEEIAGDASHRRQHVLLPVVLRERVTTASPSVTTGGAVT